MKKKTTAKRHGRRRAGLSDFAEEEYGGSRHHRRDGSREKELTRIPAPRKE
jgi:hypothetical protein